MEKNITIEEKALEVYPIEEYVSYQIDGVIDKNETKRKCFIEGAKWMKEQTAGNAVRLLDEAYDHGKYDMKEQIINKACEWLYEQPVEGTMECKKHRSTYY